WWWLAGKLAARRWDGTPPAPPPIKQMVVKSYGRDTGTRTLVETGTFRGEMVAAARWWFKEIHTIELEPVFAEMARRRFRWSRGIHVHEGDSATILPKVIESLTGPAVFWLDAHFSEGGTARGEKETPIEDELSLLLSHPSARVVLIDDARLFGHGDYPPLARVEDLARAAGRSMEIDVDIIRILDDDAGATAHRHEGRRSR
ncbi:MAG: hypothetical protein ACRDKT_17320, partial [Actinomycetota bacterium]